MKKLCAFILATTAAATIFVHTPFAAHTKTASSPIAASVSATFKSPETKPEKPITYIGNKNTKKFHLPSCYTLPKEKNRVYFSSRDRAINRNFKPCQNCNP